VPDRPKNRQVSPVSLTLAELSTADIQHSLSSYVGWKQVIIYVVNLPV